MKIDRLSELLEYSFLVGRKYGYACDEGKDYLTILVDFRNWKEKTLLESLVTSEQVIAEAENHFAELTEPVDGVPCKQWLDWRSFYTGYTDGRVKGFE